MYTLKRWSGFALALTAAALLGACGTTHLSQIRDGQTEQPVWPTVEQAHPLIPSTVHPDVEALRKIAIGMPKLEVYRLIGHPMYREGIAGVHEWDYVFKFQGEDGQETTCQYKLLFDDAMLARQAFWNPAGCARFVGATTPEVAAPAAEPHVAAADDLSADVLFDFDSATLSADAPEAISSKVAQMLARVQNVERLQVIGYTDRLGDAAYNLALSRRRAEAVRQYLVSQGVPAEAIHVEGRGATEPVVECPGANSAATKACLKPNRRVRMELIAR
ncbi:OmpA family protein [Lysobacter arvi]|uniref:OmpA family protein n=1 Tax=Lysobacter arvi TaxID=3038776 RepID=A0ABU1CIC9_9GAMM|nr:OmpA family protein [Lysobacter arvi]MDR0184694.1 OmpA family protein [Lysobacter arvi]